MARRCQRFSGWLALLAAFGCGATHRVDDETQGRAPTAPEAASRMAPEPAPAPEPTPEPTASPSLLPASPSAGSEPDASSNDSPPSSAEPELPVADAGSTLPVSAPTSELPVPDAGEPTSTDVVEPESPPSSPDAGAGGAPSSPSPDPGPVRFVLAPSFSGNPNPAVPLAGVLTLALDKPALVQVTVTGGDEAWTLELPAAREFVKPILGLKPGTTYALELQVLGARNTLTAGPLEWTTPPLPDDFPPFRTVVSEPSVMEPGMTLFNVRMGWDVTQAAMVIVDAAGVVRWYYLDADAPVLEDPRRLADGSFLFNDDQCTLRRVDTLGNAIGHWHAADYPRGCEPEAGSVPVAIQAFHHDVNMLGDDYLVLSTQERAVENYPTSEDNPRAPTQSAQILECVIVEFTPQGDVTKYIPLGDLLDTTRVGRDSVTSGWSAAYVGESETAYDWDHCNSIVYDPASDAYLVSLRNQDAVVKIDRSSESLVWILGTPSNWVQPWSDKLLAPVGDLEWPFHQHAAHLNRFGLGLYDNGKYRAAAYENPVANEYSRAVVYSIDEKNRTVSQVWSYGPASGDQSFYSSSMGDADWLTVTDNVLIVNAQIETQSGAYAQILEVTQEGERAFELLVGQTNVEGDWWGSSVYTVYRAERIADLRR